MKQIIFLFICLAFIISLSYGQQTEKDSTDLKSNSSELNIDKRLTVLEKTVDTLLVIIILIPSLAGLIVIASEIRAWFSEKARISREKEAEKSEKDLLKGREEVSIRLTNTINSVMSSVNQLLSFQAKQAETLSKQIETGEKLSPSQGIKKVVDDVIKLRSQIKRYSLHQHYQEIVRIADRMESMEGFYPSLDDFKQSINCNHVRGLAGLLRSEIETTDKYFNAVSELIKSGQGLQEKDDYVEPVSLYFRGISLKNIASFDEASKCFEHALNIWPKKENEIQTRVELAETIAFQTKYAEDKKVTKLVHDAIDKMLADDSKDQKMKDNLKILKGRLYLIDGNYAFKYGNWDDSIEYYIEASKLNPTGVFINLSIGLSHWKKQSFDEAKTEFIKVYNLIVDSDMQIKHPEPRGRILLGGSAIISAKLNGFSNANELKGDLLNQMEFLRWKSIQSDYKFHIFSPLTKQLESLKEFRNHIERPTDFL